MHTPFFLRKVPAKTHGMEWSTARTRFMAGWKRIRGLCAEWEEVSEASRCVCGVHVPGGKCVRVS